MELERRRSLTSEVDRKTSVGKLKDLRRRMSQVKEEDRKFYNPLGPQETVYLPRRYPYVKALNYPTKFLRRMQLGIECPTYLDWRHWYPGEQFRKTFVIKNTGRRTLVCMHYFGYCTASFSLQVRRFEIQRVRDELQLKTFPCKRFTDFPVETPSFSAFHHGI